jgi:hypothetical protein
MGEIEQMYDRQTDEASSQPEIVLSSRAQAGLSAALLLLGLLVLLGTLILINSI